MAIATAIALVHWRSGLVVDEAARDGHGRRLLH